MLTLITPTGGRPEAFALCERWMAAQTVKWDQWIVVDDCDPPTPTTLGQTVIRPEPLWQPGDNTQARNLLAALPLIEGDLIAIIEDDDWYGPRYLESIETYLQIFLAVGQIPACYYNVPASMWRNNKNDNHASLCQTAFHASELRNLEAVIHLAPKFIDLEFWHRERAIKEQTTLLYTPKHPLCVGMKGLPGRDGIGGGHIPGRSGWNEDNGDKLRELLGDDARLYEQWRGNGA